MPAWEAGARCQAAQRWARAGAGGGGPLANSLPGVGRGGGVGRVRGVVGATQGYMGRVSATSRLFAARI